MAERIKAVPGGTAGKAEPQARRTVVLGLASALGPIVTEITALDAQIRERSAAHPDAAIFRLADSTRYWHPWADEVHRRARAMGQDHPHAIRTLGRAWIRVLWRCWGSELPYDAERHGNFNRLQTAGG